MRWLLLFILISCQESFLLKDQKATISGAAITNGKIILSGIRMNSIQSITPVSPNLSGYTMTIFSKTSEKLQIAVSHASNNALALSIGTVLSFTVNTASAQITVNLTVDGTPSGTVSSFNLASCPTGWSDYTPAEGRFIAGYDPAVPAETAGFTGNAAVTPLSVTLDIWANAAATSPTPAGGNNKLGIANSNYAGDPIDTNIYAPGSGSVSISNPTTVKPKYVVLKYCEKD